MAAYGNRPTVAESIFDLFDIESMYVYLIFLPAWLVFCGRCICYTAVVIGALVQLNMCGRRSLLDGYSSNDAPPMLILALRYLSEKKRNKKARREKRLRERERDNKRIAGRKQNQLRQHWNQGSSSRIA